jgi:hypothetical protein
MTTEAAGPMDPAEIQRMAGRLEDVRDLRSELASLERIHERTARSIVGKAAKILERADLFPKVQVEHVDGTAEEKPLLKFSSPFGLTDPRSWYIDPDGYMYAFKLHPSEEGVRRSVVMAGDIEFRQQLFGTSFVSGADNAVLEVTHVISVAQPNRNELPF